MASSPLPYKQLPHPNRDSRTVQWRQHCSKLTWVVLLMTLTCLAMFGAWQWVNQEADLIDELSWQQKQTTAQPMPETTAKPVEMKFVCYYSLPSQSDNQKLAAENVDASLCTHINIAFSRIASNNSLSPNGPHDFEDYKRVVKLKDHNPKLKVLLSVQSDMGVTVANHSSRKAFIKSCLATLKLFKLDGVDLDWEFPNDAVKFTTLLAELREAFGSQYLLTVAVAAPQPIASLAYKIDVMSRFVDWVNLMAYDFHAYNTLTPFTGLNAPLYAGKNEHGYMGELNTNWSAHYWESQGMPRNKIVVGMPTYCHTFTLVNSNNHYIGAPASDGGSFSYPDLCKFLLDGAAMVTDKFTRNPYAFEGKTWVSFENERSVGLKAEFVVNGRYAGAMIWSLNHDDHTGSCYDSGNPFPLSKKIKTVLEGKHIG